MPRAPTVSSLKKRITALKALNNSQAEMVQRAFKARDETIQRMRDETALHNQTAAELRATYQRKLEETKAGTVPKSLFEEALNRCLEHEQYIKRLERTVLRLTVDKE